MATPDINANQTSLSPASETLADVPVEQVLDAVENSDRLPLEERRRLAGRVRQKAATLGPKSRTVANMIANVFEGRLIVEPRKTERDMVIVRLHDKEGLTFGQIGRRLRDKNPDWAGKNGKPLSAVTVRKAYTRMKERLRQQETDKCDCPC